MAKSMRRKNSRKSSKKSKRKSSKKRPPNPWITHCKSYAKKHNMKYRDVLGNAGCKAAYKKK